MDAKKFLAGISIVSIIGGIGILNGANSIDKEKVVIAKSGWGGWGGKSVSAGSMEKMKKMDNMSKDNESKKAMKKNEEESGGWG